ncbi:NAD(P)/FAD-dependent oxidoreductase [Dehalogenimonas etheniformans]|uniref:NAD(P)/FAD-dependent oxidoreductase n=1 Tax=Dehalogenimonas etheniformans TaxID=1536648 RepID=A0A2P5P5Z8_9CHLR|nr:NAD(P)/FAD-dependent oxidoreductase [Dehalogenimonas etheniformans]PPD57726.1 NAD(P)/FAD-dependent oxidoreductase [Dehalogenimonas etheniformans]QNT76066.1 NAD(P)/FAD-dependent oxidoreductase [Dehalogenimonas etheniformans]
MNFDADVIVVGAGPAGSRAAARLAAAGHDVILLERRQNLGQPICCTGIISVQCLEQFNISPDLVLRKYCGAAINGPGGGAINLSRPSVQAVAIDRARFDREMAESAVSSGARLFLGATVTHIKTSLTEAKVGFTVGGSTHTISARCVVVAAGLSPRLTGQLGMGKISRAALGFQTEVATPQPVGVEVYVDRKYTPGYFSWMAPISDIRAKIGLIARRRVDANLPLLVDRLRSQGRIGAELDGVRCRAIPLSTLPRTFNDRVIAVGDSAGQVKPTTGGGLYYGLLCADMAADTLGTALAAGDLTAGSLKKYEQAWRSAIGRDLLIGRLGRSLFQRIPEPIVDRLMLKARDSGAVECLLKDDDFTFDWHGKAILKAAGALLASIF